MDRAVIETPVGAAELVVDGDGALTRLRLLGHGPVEPASARGRGVDAACSALGAYFAGDLGALDALPVRAAGTAFQQSVWGALRRIPAGQTRSYAELAAEIGQPGAVRAVGRANGANPVAVVVPCHRVIRADGSLGGYGFGPPVKRWLLRHEGVAVDGQLELAT